MRNDPVTRAFQYSRLKARAEKLYGSACSVTSMHASDAGTPSDVVRATGHLHEAIAMLIRSHR